MAIIPAPIRLERPADEAACCAISAPVTVSFSGEGADAVAGYLSAHLNAHLRLESLAEPQADAADAEGTGAIRLCVAPELEGVAGLPNPREAYRLGISQAGVLVQATAPHGLFNGVQSLLQLLPPRAGLELQLPLLQVTDSPRFPWRGVLLDVGRHFYSVAFVKRLLDTMAFYKLNKFHWHLTEDQGWRLEVRQFPRLTEVGAWRGPKGRQYGGFYTQQEVREIVAYAAERFIEVIPEIELPGHCRAALACYPELSCTRQASEVPDYWGIQEDVYCAGSEEVFGFLEAVLTEVIVLFPSQYLHIGGDECPKTRWARCAACQRRMRAEGLADECALQSWFIGRIARFLASKGRRLIGWDEILEGGLHPGTIVMSWRGITGGVRAARQGHQVIMTPTSHCYFDYRQSLRSDEPGAWFAMLPLEQVYAFDPVPPLPQPSEASERGAELQAVPEPPAGAPALPFAEVSRSPDSVLAASLARANGGSLSGAEAMACEQARGGDAMSDSDGDARLRGDSSEGCEPEAPDLVFSASLPAAFQGRPQDDWTLEPQHAPLILGGQANVWTEYIGDEETCEYMLLPRLCAMAEALWSPPAERAWPGFLERLQAQLPHLDARGLRYRPLG